MEKFSCGLTVQFTATASFHFTLLRRLHRGTESETEVRVQRAGT